MAFINMWTRLRGMAANMTVPLAKTLINEALGDIYDEGRWSFQLQESGWLTPGLFGAPGQTGISPGTISVVPYTNTITGNATASAAWIAAVGRPFLTEQQIRIPTYNLYDIVAMNAANPNAVVLTIDRPWMEPAQTNSAYMIYEAYFPVPVKDFIRFLTFRDFTNTYDMDYWKTKQQDLAVLDPQRTIFQNPTRVVPYETDQRAGSATLGNMRYELWPGPLSSLPYSFSFMRRGPLLVNPLDTVPYPLKDSLVINRALMKASLFKETQKGEDVQRGVGADWKFLYQAAEKEYNKDLNEIKNVDRNLVNLFWTKLRRRTGFGTGPFFNGITGGLSIGGFNA